MVRSLFVKLLDVFFMRTGGARAYWLKYIKEKKLQILTNEGKVNQKKLERKIKQKTRSQIKTRKLLDVRLPSSCFMFEAGVFLFIVYLDIAFS